MTRRHNVAVVVGAAVLAVLCIGHALPPLPAQQSAPSGPLARAAAAAYPTPQEETYQGCPPQGDGGDAQLNLLKNRIDAGHWQPIALSDVLALTWPRAVERMRRSNWPAAAAETVARTEGRPVVTEGYILKVRHEGPESPNCHDATQRDYHVWLAATSAAARAHAVIVELTPRVVARNAGWGTPIDIEHLAGQRVRISGWLLLDQEHPEQLGYTRGTLWEIHPVMAIAVLRRGRWIDLASGKPAPASTPVPAAPSATAASSSPRSLRVVVVVRPNPTSYRTPTTITGTTTPGARCGVRVAYASGTLSSSSHLRTDQTADARGGRVSWTWSYGSRTTGTASVTVRCTLGSQSAVGTARLAVR